MRHIRHGLFNSFTKLIYAVPDVQRFHHRRNYAATGIAPNRANARCARRKPRRAASV